MVTVNSQAAHTRRLHRDAIHRTNVVDLACGHIVGSPANRPRVNHNIAIDCDQPSRSPHIGVMHWRNHATAAVNVVIVIRNVSNVHDARVANIHVPEIAPAGPIPGVERFTPTQRTPSQPATEAKPEAHAPSWSTKPRH